ncbi:hypothetical protein WOLCODRAFT_166861 [Wolfiporia cocos MD-104 SS10]|uniref:F-box domain-containing protein n=1 Tax=Wolfiporia cocos (strain MD-104) TaxID=742152 RepID=A0A2H3J274_WOLCO|nr:hypothetical protein WOLCODRAFT_166861 [Wolfiporia cocos MD-104 SS10]
MSAKQHRRAQIETEITRLNRSVVKLKSELNMLSPISVLPQEILAEIFITLSEAVGYKAFDYPHLGRRHDVRFLITHDNSFKDFFNALENMPLLGFLELEHAAPSLPSSMTEIPAPTRIITLSRLHSIRLFATTPADCIYALSHLSFPALSTFSLLTRATEYLKELSKCLADKVPFWERIRMLDYSRKLFGHFQIQGSDSQEGFSDDHPRPRYTFDLMLTDSTSPLTTLATMVEHIPWRMVHTLHVPDSSYGSASQWVAAFHPLKQVTTLEVSGKHVTPELVRALCICVRESGKPTAASRKTSMKLFPLLRSISFSNVRFAEWETYDVGLVGELTELLLDCLARRRDRGVEIRKLQITNCFNIGRDIEPLREIVPSLDWDGKAMVIEPDSETESSVSDYYEDVDPFEFNFFDPDPIFQGWW